MEKVDLMEIMSLDRIDSNRKSFIDDVSVSLYVNHYKGILAVAYIQSDKMCDRNLSNESLMKMEEAMNSIFARDDKTGNFGNGEFVIFTYSCSDEEELKKRISQAAVMADLNDVEIFLGCAFVSEDLREFSLLYEKADNNMLKIKGTK